MSINSSNFLSVLKSADVTPMHKKDLCYQPVSVLPNPSKIFENILLYKCTIL